MRKNFKILIFSKMAPTILTKFSGFIVYSKPSNMTLSAFRGKIPETGKIVFSLVSFLKKKKRLIKWAAGVCVCVSVCVCVCVCLYVCVFVYSFGPSP